MKHAVLLCHEVSIENSSPNNQTIEININCDAINTKLFLPSEKGLRYQFFPRYGLKSFKVEAKKATVRVLSGRQGLSRRVMNLFIYKQHRKIAFTDFRFGVAGPYPARRVFYDFIRHLRDKYGNIDICLMTIREFWTGWSTQVDKPVQHKKPIADGKTAVVVCHMYYMEVLDEIAALINSRQQEFDVIITIPCEMEDWQARIIEKITSARVFTFENKGRDVRPFLKLLEQGLLDDYDLVCKIHGKMSRGGERKQAAGDYWRRRLFYELLGNQSALDRTLAKFTEDALVGMIGPAAYHCPGSVIDERVGWSDNRLRILDLAERMGITESEYRLDFFAGTMFWVRPEALTPLRSLALAESYFEPECGLLDGGPEHAIERILGTSVIKAGFRLEETW